MPGDIVLSSSAGVFGWAIRLVTGSGFSHAQLVVSPSAFANAQPFNFQVLEVGWNIRLARFRSLDHSQFAIYRPRIPGLEPGSHAYLHWAWKLNMNIRNLLKQTPRRYPFWKLPIYLVRRDWRGRLLGKGPRQVCSVMTARPLVAAGWPLTVWSGDERVVIDEPGEVRSLTPGDLARACVEGGADLLYATRDAPIL